MQRNMTGGDQSFHRYSEFSHSIQTWNVLLSAINRSSINADLRHHHPAFSWGKERKRKFKKDGLNCHNASRHANRYF